VNKRVLVAMSGGVDSSVTAAILLKQGYEVIGVTFKFWSKQFCGKQKSKSCCSLKDIEDARRVAAKLKIPFYVLSAHKEFEKHIIDYFCKEYSLGRTPNPCIICNDKIKFGLLLEKARKLNAGYVATGHYAQVIFNKRRKEFVLKRAKYRKKDQSYALFGLRQKQLAAILMPMGKLDKLDVRKLALKIGLRVHDKPDSQEICFIWEGNYKDFLRQRNPKAFISGDILDTSGHILGRHKGIASYTIGQREGLGIAKEKPIYVLNIDRKNNAITVGYREQLNKKTLIASRVNWIETNKPAGRIKVKAKIRYRHTRADATIYPLEKNRVKIVFNEPQFAITPGQAVVFYKNEEILGGGWIEETK